MAASSNPVNLDNTAMPVRCSTFSTLSAISSRRSTPPEATSKAAAPISLSCGVEAEAPITMTVPMEAGPMHRGIANGTTLISASTGMEGWSVVSFINDTAVRNSNTPEPIRKASSVKPNTPKILSPKKYRTTPITNTATPV